MRLRLIASLSLAVAASLAHAQTTTQLPAPVVTDADTTVLPVWNNDSGRIEALLLLEPAQAPRDPLTPIIGPQQLAPVIGAGTRTRLADGGTIETALKIEPGSKLALLCSGKSGLVGTLGALAEHCLLAQMDAHPSGDPLAARGGGRLSLEAGFEHRDYKLSIGAGASRIDLDGGAPLSANPETPAWLATNPLAPLGIAGGRIDQADLGAVGEMRIGNDGWVSIGGTVARARLVPANEAGTLPDQWDTTTIGVGAGYGSFSGSIIGRVVEVPGQEAAWSSLGLGFSWRTPWRGQLSVGAENLMSSGKNPWTPTDPAESADEGSVPYVRYQQDL